jgi:hypothetical protein
MRKLVTALTVGTALVTVPASSAQEPGCREFGQAVASTQELVTIPGFFGHVMAFFAQDVPPRGNPLLQDRQLHCGP